MDISQTLPGPTTDLHVHIGETRCPICDQPVPDEMADQVRVRMRELSDSAIASFKEQERIRSTVTSAETQQQIDALARENAALTDVNKVLIADAGRFKIELEKMKRQVEKSTPVELGDREEIKLFEELKETFRGDQISRVPKGSAGADIIHVVFHNGKQCGTIIYDAKNRNAWQNNFVTKLREDQIAEKAEHAILATCTLPTDVQQLAVREGVIIANPARVLAIAEILRREIIHSHELQIVGQERGKKTEDLYSYITSPTFTQHLDSIQILTNKMRDLDAAEQSAHKRLWKKRDELIRSVQAAQSELRVDVDQIVGTDGS